MQSFSHSTDLLAFPRKKIEQAESDILPDVLKNWIIFILKNYLRTKKEGIFVNKTNAVLTAMIYNTRHTEENKTVR